MSNFDTNFYYRTVQRYFFKTDGSLSIDIDSDAARKDASTLARLLWHHGSETLITLLGAYVQSPHAVYAFFLKCSNSDAREIAKYLLSGNLPKYHCLVNEKFKLRELIDGIHMPLLWTDRDPTIERFSGALTELLRDFQRDDHRAEYNNIKHGLRAKHGQFALAFGIQDSPDIPAPPERMQTLGASKDASHFLVAKPIVGLSKAQNNRQFLVNHQSVGWTLEKVLCEIQFVSILIGNIVSALRVAAGVDPSQVSFNRPADAEDWWTQFEKFDRMPLQNVMFGRLIEPLPAKLNVEKVVADFYKRREG